MISNHGFGDGSRKKVSEAPVTYSEFYNGQPLFSTIEDRLHQT